MALVSDLLYSNFSTIRGLGYGHGTEMYYVKDDGVEPIHPVINRANEVDWANAVPITVGSAHPTIPGAICKDKRVVELAGPRQARVLVVYSSDVRWGGGRLLQAESGSEVEPLTIPMWQQRVTGVFEYSPVQFHRHVNTLVKPVFVNDWNDTLSAVVFVNVGKVKQFGPLWYELMGYDAVKLPTNQTVVTYRFSTRGPVPEYPVPSEYGWFSSVVALDIMEEYEVYIDGTVPAVRAREFVDIYEPCGALPGNP